MPNYNSPPTLGIHSNKSEIDQRLFKFAEEYPLYDLKQENGQRIFQYRINIFYPKGAEIHINNLPHNAIEDVLVPMFMDIGPLFQFRLMLNFSGYNRGFAYATFFHVNHAIEAIKRLNGKMLWNRVLTVSRSIDNRRLFVGNIPDNKSRKDVFDAISEHCAGVVDVILYPSPEDETKNRGYAFVEFSSHGQASVIKKQFFPRNLQLWGKSIHVDWADPLPIVDPVMMEKVKALYVRNLPQSMTSTKLHKMINSRIGVGFVEKIYIKNGFGFINCCDRQSGALVLEKLHGVMVDNRRMMVDWAIPQQYAPKNRPLDNVNYNSVPYNQRVMQREQEKNRED